MQGVGAIAGALMSGVRVEVIEDPQPSLLGSRGCAVAHYALSEMSARRTGFATTMAATIMSLTAPGGC